MTDEAGFTLIEVMVATFIMGVLSVMGLVMLDDTLSSKETLEYVLEEVQDIEQARAIIKNDLAQIVSRTARDEFGFKAESVFVGGADLDNVSLMSFVRNGNEMPGLTAASSSLQHVEYRFENGVLSRRTRSRVDAATDTPILERELLTNLASAQIEFYDGLLWTDKWIGQMSASNAIPAPAAVGLILHSARYGPVRMLFYTPAGY
ncbi:type II secretion system minor pseudopilin GspJ [Hirschia baltica]|uniref:Type II secretion system protein J n=1 Tax=Hirschia baltica (strain ATCC 49814 / DSM 5838 / IFAM 1418) TaxID=582402 RepID=C6XJ53_HIRBI|nr:type II secretion system minor pseudopilin GspJ [Hirschia baltica]ACT59148.1 general secretion pathway protein J [Hirschia baltica ATCC 49814]